MSLSQGQCPATQVKLASQPNRALRTVLVPTPKGAFSTPFRSNRMNRRLFATVLLASVLCGCATQREPGAYDQTKYQFGSNYPVMNRESAEATIVTAMLTKQINPPLDSPLVLEAVTLPSYPQSLQRSNVQGRVTIRFSVDAEGIVQDVMLVGTAPKSLVELSLLAIQKWKFRPPIRGGSPTALQLTYWFNFELR